MPSVLSCRFGQVPIRGFEDQGNALAHTEKHFLSPRESWDQICPAAAGLRGKWISGGGQEVVAEAAGPYEQTALRQVTSNTVLVGWNQGRGFPALEVATLGGVYAALRYRKGGVSDLRTAYRPPPRVGQGPFSPRHYMEAARRKVAACR